MIRMNQAKFFTLIIGIVALVVLAACTEQNGGCPKDAKPCLDGSTVWRTGPNCEFPECPAGAEPNNFEDCSKIGFVMESHPKQCKTRDGKTFVEEIKESPSVNANYTSAKTIETRDGQLTLSYFNDGKSIYGTATLKGKLSRGTPCVNWTVIVGGTEDMQRSQVNIDIFNSNKGVMCIQVVGEPQEINEIIDGVTESSKYIVKFEDEVIASGIKFEDKMIDAVYRLCNLHDRVNLFPEVKKSTDGGYYKVTTYQITTFVDSSTGEKGSLRTPAIDFPVMYYDRNARILGYCGGLSGAGSDFCESMDKLKFEGLDLCQGRL